MKIGSSWSWAKSALGIQTAIGSNDVYWISCIFYIFISSLCRSVFHSITYNVLAVCLAPCFLFWHICLYVFEHILDFATSFFIFFFPYQDSFITVETHTFFGHTWLTIQHVSLSTQGCLADTHAKINTFFLLNQKTVSVKTTQQQRMTSKKYDINTRITKNTKHFVT